MAHPEWHISCELLGEFLGNCPEIEWLNVLMEIEKKNPDPTQMLEVALKSINMLFNCHSEKNEPQTLCW